MPDLLAALPIPLAEQIKCVERELGFRRQVYPRRVALGKMKPGAAELEVRRMEAVLNTLRNLERRGQ